MDKNDKNKNDKTKAKKPAKRSEKSKKPQLTIDKGDLTKIKGGRSVSTEVDSPAE
jgi:hypothetical protein